MAGQGPAGNSANDVYTLAGQHFAGLMEMLRLQHEEEKTLRDEQIGALRQDLQASKGEVAALRDDLDTVKTKTNAEIRQLRGEIASRIRVQGQGSSADTERVRQDLIAVQNENQVGHPG